MDKLELIARLKEAAQSLIDNAESIVGSEKTLQNINISIDINNVDKVPCITVQRDFIPEAYLSRITNINFK